MRHYSRDEGPFAATPGAQTLIHKFRSGRGAGTPSWPRDALKMAAESGTTLTAAIGQDDGNAVGLAVER
jgi:hypothetical protein